MSLPHPLGVHALTRVTVSAVALSHFGEPVQSQIQSECTGSEDAAHLSSVFDPQGSGLFRPDPSYLHVNCQRKFSPVCGGCVRVGGKLHWNASQACSPLFALTNTHKVSSSEIQQIVGIIITLPSSCECLDFLKS